MHFDDKTHRRQSIRLPEYNYSQNGYYFITICCKERACLFGEVIDGKMIKNELGDIVEEYWYKIEELHDFVCLDEFVVMPNHVHGILAIDNNDVSNVGASIHRAHRSEQTYLTFTNHNNRNTPIPNTRRDKSTPLHKNDQSLHHTTPMGKKTLGEIIRWYKGRCTFECRKIQFDFSWQRNYHEHIIRNEKSLEKIQEYIKYNPLLWKEDCYHHI